jgi:transposase-like protein
MTGAISRNQGRSRRMVGQMVGQVSAADSLAEENIERTLAFFRPPRQHNKHLNSTNLLERLNEEIGAEPMSCASSQTPKAACVWSARWPSKPTKTGWSKSLH